MSLSDDAFANSCLASDAYPQCLVPRSTNVLPSALKSFRSSLDSVESHLFVKSETHVELPIRDLQTADGKDLEKRNIHGPEQLRSWLGTETRPDPNDPSKQQLYLTKKDPKSRFIYFYAEHGRASLKVFRGMMTTVFTYHQVMPAYLDFVSVFGDQSEPHDLRFSGFRDQTTLFEPPQARGAKALGRSERRFQLCYNLKNVALKSKDFTNEEWSIRQAAIHHQFDVVSGNALWIVTKGNLDLHERYKELTSKSGKPEYRAFGTIEECLRSSLAVHLMFCQWSAEGWRWHTRWLERRMRATDIAAYGPREEDFNYREYGPDDIMSLSRFEDKVGETIMALNSNVEILGLIRGYYIDLLANEDFPKGLACAASVKDFNGRVDEIIQNLRMELSRTKLLVKNAKDRKDLIIQHLQTQASGRIEKVSFRMEQEAVVVRVVTIVTLIYLPATFVSTFFSTDIIKYQNPNGSPDTGTFSPIAMERWLQVALPLTALTLFAAWLSMKRATLKSAGHGLMVTQASRTLVKSESMLPLTKKMTNSEFV